MSRSGRFFGTSFRPHNAGRRLISDAGFQEPTFIWKGSDMSRLSSKLSALGPIIFAVAFVVLAVLPPAATGQPEPYDCSGHAGLIPQPCQFTSQCGGCTNYGGGTGYQFGTCNIGQFETVSMYSGRYITDCLYGGNWGYCVAVSSGTCWADWIGCVDSGPVNWASCAPTWNGGNGEYYCRGSSNTSCRHCDPLEVYAGSFNMWSYECHP